MKKLLVSIFVSLMLVAIMAVPAIAATDGSLGASATVNQFMSLTVVDNTPGSGINFGSVNDGASDNPDLAQTASTGAVTLQVGSETNVAVNLQTRGTGDFSGPGTAIPLANAHWNDTNSTTGYTEMTTSYATVGSVAAGGGDLEVWHWLSVPDSQVAGTYSTTFWYQVIAP